MFISVVGLSIDCSLFYILVLNTNNIIFSNCLSASVAIIFIYCLSKKVFLYSGNYSLKQFSAFLIYYIMSIYIFSCIINVINLHLIEGFLLAKLLTVPVSFLVNYYFSSKILYYFNNL